MSTKRIRRFFFILLVLTAVAALGMTAFATTPDESESTEITIEWTSTGKTYDGKAATPAANYEGKKVTVTCEGSSEMPKDQGTYTMKASLEGYTITNDTIQYTISARNVTLTSEGGSKTYDGSALTKPDVTVGGDGFVSGEVSNIKATGSVTNVSDGEVTNAISYTTGGNFKADNYSISKTEGKLKINVRSVTLTSEDGIKTYDGAPLEKPNVTVGGDGFVSGEASNIKATGSATNVSDGEVTNEISYTTGSNFKADNYSISKTEGKLKINARSVTLTSEEGIKIYDGTPLEKPNVTVGGDGFVSGEVSEIKATGTVTNVSDGEVDNAISYKTGTKFKEDNYTISTTEGKLKINVRSVTLKSEGGSKTYDGTALTKEEVEVGGDGFVEGEVSEIKATGTVTNVSEGEVTNTISYKKGRKFQEDNYSISTTEGKLKINARSVTLTSESGNKEYDGTPLEKPDVKVTGDGFVSGEVSEIKATGSVTNVADSPVDNTITYKEESAFKADNYKIEKKEGKLSIGPSTMTITITGDIQNVIYNADEQKAEGYEAESDSKLFDEKKIVFTGTDSVTGKDVDTYPMGLDKSQFSYDDTNFENVTFVVKDGSLKISKRALTIVPDEGQSKVFDTEDPELTYTVESEDGKDYSSEVTGRLSREKENDKISGTSVGEGQKKGTYKFSIAELEPSKNVTIELSGSAPVFTIEERVITIVPGKGQNKDYGAADPTFTYSITGTGDSSESVYKIWINNGKSSAYELERKDGEKIGTYAYDFTGAKDATSSLSIEEDDEPEFEINGEFAGTIKLTNKKVSTRTNKLTFTVSGIEADLSGAKAVLKVLGGDADLKATVSGNGEYTITVSKRTETGKGGKSYYTYLDDDTYDVVLEMPEKGSGTVEDDSVCDKSVDVKKDTIPSITIVNNNSKNNGLNLIGKDANGADDTLSLKLSGNFSLESRAWAKSSDKEIIKLTIEAEGRKIGEEYINTTDVETKITTEVYKALANVGGKESVSVTITAEIVTPDLKSTKTSRTFRYDTKAKELKEADITDLNNRAFSFHINLPEEGKILAVSVTGFNSVNVSSITYEGGDHAGYGTKATVPLTFPVDPLPSTNADVTIKYEDLAGNVHEFKMSGIPKGTALGNWIRKVEPTSVGNTDDPKKKVVQGTNMIKLIGAGAGYERILITMTTEDGFKKQWTTSVTGSSETWGPEMDDYWEYTIGDRQSEEFLDESLDLPSGVPITVTVSYLDVLGGEYKIVLIYDDECQQPVLLTPPYPGMQILTGYAEPGSVVTVNWSGDPLQAAVSPFGFFTVVFPEGVYDPEITLEITDIAGNTLPFTVSVPGRSRDVDMAVKAYPVGALIADDIGMVQFPATPVKLADLNEGPIDIPILAANYFQVGSVRISRGEDGKISFESAIDPEFAAEGAGYFNIFAARPDADALSDGKRGAGMDPAAGYMPEEGTESFWFVYEIPATLTEDQLTLSGDPATVDLSNDESYNVMQGFAD